MSAAKFWILILQSVILAVLILAEVVAESQVAALSEAVGIDQANLSQAQREQEMLKQLIQRTALASKNDPALADLLAKHGIKFNITNHPPAGN